MPVLFFNPQLKPALEPMRVLLHQPFRGHYYLKEDRFSLDCQGFWENGSHSYWWLYAGMEQPSTLQHHPW